jgi:hypothetical protein
MNDFLKCACPHCGQCIEYPAEGTGQTVPCPTCEQPVTPLPGNAPYLPPVIPQVHFPTIHIPLPDDSPPPVSMPVQMIEMYQLTETTIRRKLPNGNSYVHRAAMNRALRAIPTHLLQLELFMVRNDSEETPVHVAARYGCLDQIPTKFLTKETLTSWDNFGKTPLHLAAQFGKACLIPKDFLTSEFLSLTTKDKYTDTLLHHIADADMLYLIPENNLTPEMWNAKNGRGLTPRDCLERTREILRASYRNIPVRAEPATEKQKEKLRWFGCTWDEGVTKGQASDALDKCARDFPEVDQAFQTSVCKNSNPSWPKEKLRRCPARVMTRAISRSACRCSRAIRAARWWMNGATSSASCRPSWMPSRL